MPDCLYLRIATESRNDRQLDRALKILEQGGVIIYPTDTVYGLGCDITNVKAVERIIRIKGMKPKDAQFSFICNDLSHIASYAKVSNQTFKLMKKNLPGPFTFILPGLNRVPEYFISKRKTVGIRVPNCPMVLELVARLQRPMLTTSIKDNDNVLEYTTNPEQIFDNFKHQVDLLIDGGFGGNIPSTVVDCTTDSYEIVRQGLGNLI